MGLFGNLFGRSREAEVYVMGDDHTPVWEPVGAPEEFTGEDADMDDDGQATHEEGFWVSEVTFETDAALGARIVVSVYVSYAVMPGYSLGLRYQYTDETEFWSYTGYEADPADDLYEDAGTARGDARVWAADLAGRDDRSRALLPRVFEWDGEPFPVGDPG